MESKVNKFVTVSQLFPAIFDNENLSDLNNISLI